MQGLKFRILLVSEAKAEVFRDILVSDLSDFETFYRAIIRAFELKGDQMASFYVSNDSWDKGHEINLMDMSYDDDALDQPANVMGKAIIKDFIASDHQKFILIYDFLAMQIFLIELIESGFPIPDKAELVMSVGEVPKDCLEEESKEDIFLAGGAGTIDDDEYGLNDYDDGYSNEDLDGLSEAEY
jgi:hypothetical protein